MQSNLERPLRPILIILRNMAQYIGQEWHPLRSAAATHKRSRALLPYFAAAPSYSLRPKLSTKSCFMRQKCQLQIGITQYGNAATSLSTSGIKTTRQNFQMSYITLFSSRSSKVIGQSENVKYVLLLKSTHSNFDS